MSQNISAWEEFWICFFRKGPLTERAAAALRQKATTIKDGDRVIAVEQFIAERGISNART